MFIYRLEFVHVRGKRGRQVPVLLLPDVVKAIDVLVKVRDAVSIDGNNLYLFPTPTRGSKNPFRVCQCLTNVARKIDGFKSPEHIKSTKLQKYVATVAQISSLNKTEMEWLSNHLGHSLEVYKNAYKLNDSAVELAKVSQLLLAVDSGNGSKLSGKRLDQWKVSCNWTQ